MDFTLTASQSGGYFSPALTRLSVSLVRTDFVTIRVN